MLKSERRIRISPPNQSTTLYDLRSRREAVGLRVDRPVGRLPDIKTSGFGFDHDLSRNDKSVES